MSINNFHDITLVKQYNFINGIHYAVEQIFGNNQMLPLYKVIGYIKYFKTDDRNTMFKVTKKKINHQHNKRIY